MKTLFQQRLEKLKKENEHRRSPDQVRIRKEKREKLIASLFHNDSGDNLSTAKSMAKK